MKNHLLLLSALLVAFSAATQLKYQGVEKICLDGDPSSLLHIKYMDNILLAKTDYPNSLVAINAQTGQHLWTKPYKVGYGIHSYGSDIIISKNVNTYDDKTSKVAMAEWLYTINATNGHLKDSVLLKYSVVYLSSSKGLTEHTAMIIQSTDNKFKSVLVNKKTGLVTFTLFAETGTTADIPNAIQVDAADKYVAVGCANGSKGLFVYDFRTGKQLLNIVGSGDIHNIVFTSDSKYCMYVQNKKLKIVNLTTLKLEKEIATENDAAHVAIHSDNENVVLSGYSVNVPLKFMNWKTGSSAISTLSVRGGVPVFTNEGYLYLPLQGGVQCIVAKDKLPYLAKVSFENSTTTVNSTTSSIVSTSTGNFKQGSRVYIFYVGDGKYYSGVISEVVADGYSIIYDDLSKTTVKVNQVKTLPPIKVGDKVQARGAGNTFYNCVVKEIAGEVVKVESGNGLEWISIRDIMQVE